MNEVKRIHLSRQPFTIAADAYKVLHEYLEAIKRQVGDNAEEVIKEVESRMAELLTEHGITGDKVVLMEDITFLKEQLGDPGAFKEDDSDTSHADNEAPRKRLFRDTEHGMIAGVAAGLGKYLNVDAFIIRLIFLVLIFVSGIGVVLYLLLWLLLPEAKTPSDQLQMQGKPVTVDSIKEIVDRADVAGATSRATRLLGDGIVKLAHAVLALVGGVIVLVASALVLGTTTIGVYGLMHGYKVENTVVLPTRPEHVLLVASGMVTLLLLAVLLFLAGLATIRRRWPARGYITIAICGAFLVASSLTTVLCIDTVPRIADTIRQMHHSTSYTETQFTKLNLIGDNTDFSFVPSSTYSVDVQYFGDQNNLQGITRQVNSNTLTIDTSKYKALDTCHAFCIYSDDNLHIVVHAPTLESVNLSGGENSLSLWRGFEAPTLDMTLHDPSIAHISGFKVDNVGVSLGADGEGHVQLAGLHAQEDDQFMVDTFNNTINISNAIATSIQTNSRLCDEYEPRVYIQGAATKVMLNENPIASADALRQLRSPDRQNAYNCVVIR